jgi:small-conductance mechanosensitive channel
MSCYWKPENRHKYKPLDMTKRPGDLSMWWVVPIGIVLAPVVIAFIMAVWYFAIPLFLALVGWHIYKGLSER